MNFARPILLLLVIVVPVLVLWGLRGRARRREAWAALGQDGRPMADGTWGWIVVVGLLIVALAGPRWGAFRDRNCPLGTTSSC